MYFLGQTLNIFTLGGLALAVGRLVDDSIVELENINRHLAMPGKDRRAAVLDAAREVAMPIFVSTITTIVVFLPTIFLEGQSKLLFIPLTFTISFSLFASFLVSRTVTPLMCLRCCVPSPPDPASPRLRDRFMRVSQAFFDRLDAGTRTCSWALGHRAVVVVGCSSCSWQPRAGAAHRQRVLPGLRREPVPRLRARRSDAGRGDREGGRPGRADVPAEPPAGRAPVDRVHRRHSAGARPSSREHRPARRAGPGLPVHAGQADASDVQIVAALRPKFAGSSRAR